MRQLVNLIGKIFGRLKVIKCCGKNKYGQYTWLCKCECGNKKIIIGTNLKNGNIKSCGCLAREMSSKRLIKHGHSRSKTYAAWRAMKARCYNKHNSNYHNYGGRDKPIVVCDRWLDKKNGFQNFLEDMGEIPEGKSLERIDNNNNYYKNNCRCATPREQCRNQRSNRLISYNNESRYLIDLAKEHKINPGTLASRLDNGWLTKKALTTPVKKKRSLQICNYERQLSNALRSLRLKENNKIGFSKYLPYNSKQLYDHLENIKNLQNNSCPMCRKSYNEIKYDVDHITPTSTVKTKEELLKLFDLKNLSLLCWYCNRHIKRDKISK